MKVLCIIILFVASQNLKVFIEEIESLCKDTSNIDKLMKCSILNILNVEIDESINEQFELIIDEKVKDYILYPYCQNFIINKINKFYDNENITLRIIHCGDEILKKINLNTKRKLIDSKDIKSNSLKQFSRFLVDELFIHLVLTLENKRRIISEYIKRHKEIVSIGFDNLKIQKKYIPYNFTMFLSTYKKFKENIHKNYDYKKCKDTIFHTIEFIDYNKFLGIFEMYCKKNLSQNRILNQNNSKIKGLTAVTPSQNNNIDVDIFIDLTSFYMIFYPRVINMIKQKEIDIFKSLSKIEIDIIKNCKYRISCCLCKTMSEDKISLLKLKEYACINYFIFEPFNVMDLFKYYFYNELNLNNFDSNIICAITLSLGTISKELFIYLKQSFLSRENFDKYENQAAKIATSATCIIFATRMHKMVF